MGINSHQLTALEGAVLKVSESDVAKYVELKRLLRKDDSISRSAFKHLYTRYYGMNTAGLTDTFRRRYFDLLFAFDAKTLNPHAYVIHALWNVKDRQGRNVPCFSFSSKLISIHDEAQPIYDRYVAGFFGLAPPKAGTKEFRIEGFADNMELLRNKYMAWINDNQFKTLTEPLFKRIPSLQQHHPVRVCDFLVWTIGRSQAASKRERKQSV